MHSNEHVYSPFIYSNARCIVNRASSAKPPLLWRRLWSRFGRSIRPSCLGFSLLLRVVSYCLSAMLRAGSVIGGVLCVCASVRTKSRKLLNGNWCNLVEICHTVNARSVWNLVTFDLE